MSSKKKKDQFSAGLVSKPFWFYEYKTYVNELAKGRSADEIREYLNSLNLAKEHDVHSIAFPAISTGVYGCPLEDATEIAVKTVAQWLEAHADYAMQVIFCCFDARTERVYQAKL